MTARLALSALVLWAAPASSEPRIELRVASFPSVRFEASSVVRIPAAGHGALEVWLTDALGEIQLSTVRVRLNDSPLTAFTSVNGLPRGCRAIVRQGATLSPDHNLQPGSENVLAFFAQDASLVSYSARFYLLLDDAITAPAVVGLRPGHDLAGVEPPPTHAPPRVDLVGEWPPRTSQSHIDLAAVVSDDEGLARIVVEVNGNDVEEILLENEVPVRKQKGFMARGQPAGKVSGDGRRVEVVIPVKLTREVNVIALRAESTRGLRTRADRTVQRDKP